MLSPIPDTPWERALWRNSDAIWTQPVVVLHSLSGILSQHLQICALGATSFRTHDR